MRGNATSAILALLVLAAGAGRAAAQGPGCQLNKLAELPVARTIFGPVITARINGIDTPFVADTGGVFSLISPAMVMNLGLKAVDMEGVSVGGAPAHKAEVKDFVIGSAAAGTLDLLVADLAGLAPKDAGVLGQNLLGVTDVEYDLPGETVRLYQTQGCGDAPRTYWAKAHHTADIVTLRPGSLLIEAAATVNGQAMHVRFDTGVAVSVLSRSAAARAGITPQTAGVTPAGQVTVGLRKAASWTAPVDSFKLGDDLQAKVKLRIADLELPTGVDMLIGADFFATHRIYVARDLRRVEFTGEAGPRP